jgi:hypothetical protein
MFKQIELLLINLEIDMCKHVERKWSEWSVSHTDMAMASNLNV